MPRLVKPRWGCRGAVCVQGFGQTDDQVRERRIELEKQPRGQRGCAHSDYEFSRLAAHLKIEDPATRRTARDKLDWCREFYLKSRIYETNTPIQGERNKALGVVKEHIAAFRTAIAELGSVPEWSLTGAGAIENPSH